MYEEQELHRRLTRPESREVTANVCHDCVTRTAHENGSVEKLGTFVESASRTFSCAILNGGETTPTMEREEPQFLARCVDIYFRLEWRPGEESNLRPDA